MELDDLQANAVAARIELDLRIGAAFTRLQTLQLQTLVAVLQEKVISYGRTNPRTLCVFSLTSSRLMSIPDPGICG